MSVAMNSRYDNKPLLRLLELYVLNAIDEISEMEKKHLAAMEPKLQSIYGISGRWDEIIASVMKFESDVPERIGFAWQQNVENAANKGIDLSPQMFAEMFVRELAPVV